MKVIKTYGWAGLFSLLASTLVQTSVRAQSSDFKPDKVSHAEPLYFDLVRDLGARKGEKEFNLGSDFSGVSEYNKNTILAEYEFAPVDRLGLEAEADLSLYNSISPDMDVPGNKLEAVRLSAQYSFFVSKKHQTTLAVGYTQIFEFTSFRNEAKNSLVTGTVYDPFFIAAKRWGHSFHTLVYICPLIEHDFGNKAVFIKWQINTSVHYTIPKTKNFIGIELNEANGQCESSLVIRPQVKIQLNKHLAVGLVTGFPVIKSKEHISSFIRIIYEL